MTVQGSDSHDNQLGRDIQKKKKKKFRGFIYGVVAHFVDRFIPVLQMSCFFAPIMGNANVRIFSSSVKINISGGWLLACLLSCLFAWFLFEEIHPLD